MAAMTTEQRRAVWARIMRDETETLGLLKADLLAAVNALDDFLETNAATINAAIPQPARGALTVAQKARLLAYVALARYGG